MNVLSRSIRKPGVFVKRDHIKINSISSANKRLV